MDKYTFKLASNLVVYLGERGVQVDEKDAYNPSALLQIVNDTCLTSFKTLDEADDTLGSSR